MDTFDQWFADYLQQDQHEVELLLSDKTATRFLIAWSLFESGRFIQTKDLSTLATEVTKNDAFRKENFLEPGRHFHSRYQIKLHYKNLMHKQISEELKGILATKCDTLTDYQLIFMLLFVVYRFRCNIFHGNKGVKSWLKFKEQIRFCIEVMQSLISLTQPIHVPSQLSI